MELSIFVIRQMTKPGKLQLIITEQCAMGVIETLDRPATY